MGIFNAYSKRHQQKSDVFSYDILPEKLKVQIVFIWENFFNGLELGDYKLNQIWASIERTICEEHGKRQLLSGRGTGSNKYDLEIYFQSVTKVEFCLDVIEIVFFYINKWDKTVSMLRTVDSNTRYKASDAIQDLNTRLLENAIGYEFREGEIIRIDNKLLHQEVVIPSLHFLSSQEFKNANDEYLSAHEHFRHGRTKECLNDSLKALETTLKIICDLNGWEYEKSKATASPLIKVILEKGLIPTFLQQHFTSLRSTLESGVPTIRNKMSGHGQGSEAIEVPMHYASYMLYLTGTTINFLVSCYKEHE